MVKLKLSIAVLSTLLTSGSVAQGHPFESGEKLGAVHFATSCSAAAQKDFDRAVALLHSFQFTRAIGGFHSALEEDATCGIAYWGIALSDWSNPFATGLKDRTQLLSGRQNADRGKALSAKTEREQAYIAAVGKLYADFENTPQRLRLLGYRDGMRDLTGKYPEDHEAQIFYALSLAASEDLSDKTYASRLERARSLKNCLKRNRIIPGWHTTSS